MKAFIWALVTTEAGIGIWCFTFGAWWLGLIILAAAALGAKIQLVSQAITQSEKA